MAFNIKTGTYTGNGSARSITGIGFQPKAVFIIGSNTNTTGTTGGGYALDSMSLPRFVSLSNNGALTTGTVTAFNADGFSLGTSVGVNENGVSYYYTAIGGDDVYTGSYTGNATDNRAITAPNFQPEFVLVQGGGETATWKASCSGNSTDDSSQAGATANLSNAIQSLDTTGFTIGTNAVVNANSTTYNYLAIKTLSGASSVQYTGNGADDRNITGFTSTPKFALIKQTSTARPASRYDSMTSGNAYIHQNGNVLSSNIIQSFSSGTLQVGTDSTTNNNGSTYNAVVFGERTVNYTVFSSCVGYWKLDESSGNASDATDNGYNLTNTNASYTSAVIGNGITFGTSNTNRYLSNANNMGVNGGSVTIAGWVKGNASIGSSIWTLFNLGGTTTDTRYMILYDYNGGTRRLLFWRTKVNVADQGPSYTIDLGTSNFYHLAITYDGTNVRGYVNGALVAGPTAASGNGIANQADVFSMGALTENGSTYSLYSNTIQDEVGVWTRSLSGSELTELYNGGTGLSFPSAALPHTETATVDASASYVRKTSKIQTATVDASVTYTKRITQTIAALFEALATDTNRRVYIEMVLAAIGATVNIAMKMVYGVRETASVAASVAVTTHKTLLRTITAAVDATATTIKKVSQTLVATAEASATEATVKVKHVIETASVIAAATTSKALTLNRSLTASAKAVIRLVFPFYTTKYPKRNDDYSKKY